MASPQNSYIKKRKFGSCRFNEDNDLCSCKATPNCRFNIDIYNKKCDICGHAYSVHCLNDSPLISVKKFFKFVSLVNSDIFKNICFYLVFEDIITLDQTFLNKYLRLVWNKFLIEVCQFTVRYIHLSKLVSWLEQKHAEVILSQESTKMFKRFFDLMEMDVFKHICLFLTLQDLSIMDRAITNEVGRYAWNRFLKEKCEFRIIKYYISYHAKNDNLFHLAKWLRLKKAKATLLHMKFVPNEYIWHYEKIFSNINLISKTLLTSNLKELTIELSPTQNQNIYLFHFLIFACYKCTNLQTLRLIFPSSRNWLFNHFMKRIVEAEMFRSLETIYLERFGSNNETEINEIKSYLKNSSTLSKFSLKVFLS